MAAKHPSPPKADPKRSKVETRRAKPQAADERSDTRPFNRRMGSAKRASAQYDRF